MGKSLVEKIEAELKRPIPDQYSALIRLGLGHPEQAQGINRKSLFFPIDEPHAFFLQQWIEKDANLGLAAAGILRLNTDEENLTEFGILLRKLVSSKDFLDMGCGNPCLQNPASEYALLFGANRYIGVDMNLTPEQCEKYSVTNGRFEKIYVKDEMLRFLARIPAGGLGGSGIALFFSAIESGFDFQRYMTLFEKKNRTDADLESLDDEVQRAQYHQALYSEIGRITKLGDVVLFGRRTSGLFPDYLLRQGFSKVDHSSTCALYIKNT